MGITFRWIYLSLCSKNGATQEERGICVFLSVCINVLIILIYLYFGVALLSRFGLQKQQQSALGFD